MFGWIWCFWCFLKKNSHNPNTPFPTAPQPTIHDLVDGGMHLRARLYDVYAVGADVAVTVNEPPEPSPMRA
jgi:hypothetical protein